MTRNLFNEYEEPEKLILKAFFNLNWIKPNAKSFLWTGEDNDFHDGEITLLDGRIVNIEIKQPTSRIFLHRGQLSLPFDIISVIKFPELRDTPSIPGNDAIPFLKKLSSKVTKWGTFLHSKFDADLVLFALDKDPNRMMIYSTRALAHILENMIKKYGYRFNSKKDLPDSHESAFASIPEFEIEGCVVADFPKLMEELDKDEPKYCACDFN